MSERDIIGHVKTLVDAFKRLDKTTGKEKHSLEIVAETSAVVLVTGVIVDLHRIANALEHLVQK